MGAERRADLEAEDQRATEGQLALQIMHEEQLDTLVQIANQILSLARLSKKSALMGLLQLAELSCASISEPAKLSASTLCESRPVTFVPRC